MNLFTKANAGLYLTPIERAVLRFLEACVAATVVAMLPAVSAALTSQSPDWGTVLRTAVATFAVAVLLSLSKWAKAHGDNNLCALADDGVTAVQHANPGTPEPTPPDFPPGAPSLAALGLPTAPDATSEPAPLAAAA